MRLLDNLLFADENNSVMWEMFYECYLWTMTFIHSMVWSFYETSRHCRITQSCLTCLTSNVYDPWLSFTRIYLFSKVTANRSITTPSFFCFLFLFFFHEGILLLIPHIPRLAFYSNLGSGRGTGTWKVTTALFLPRTVRLTCFKVVLSVRFLLERLRVFLFLSRWKTLARI